MDEQIIIKAVNEALNGREGRISHDTHKTHHDFVAGEIEKRVVRAKRAEKIKTQIMGWGVMVTITAVAGGLGKWILELLHHGSKQ